MPVLNVTDRDGTSSLLTAAPGTTLMAALRAEGMVEAICGGTCSCATCHVHIAAAWWEAVGPPTLEETTMLEFSLERRETSRLACQVLLGPEHDGLALSIAPAEG
ncbi:MAG: 2Fe-2S iron-sulfur cluster binding domain-containing protein [Gammaproteobacteria bacterium]|nr:2Fe-2S iron-sulfur cluster binding domain-containing protein [Gammaproteobacteria bacterium]